MSHLTQILVPYELAVRQVEIRDSYDWHQRVWQAFKGHDVEKREFLSRVDEIDDAYRLLIVSPVEPTKPDWCPTDCFKTKAIPEDFFAAGQFHFSLLVNPTRKLVVRNEAGERKKNGRRIALTKREDLLAWMQRKAEAGGFAIGDPESLRTITSEPNCQGFIIQRWGNPDRRDVTLSGLQLIAESWTDSENCPF